VNAVSSHLFFKNGSHWSLRLVPILLLL
jgi:hypothetical protein